MDSKKIEQIVKENKQLKSELIKLKKEFAKFKTNHLKKTTTDFYRTLFEFSPSGIIIENKDGTILDVNPAWCKSLGYRRNEIIGKKVHKLAHPLNYNKVNKNLKELLAGKKLKHIVKSVKKDGKECYIQLNECSIKLADGEQRILSISQDITKEYQAQIALKGSEKTYRELFNNATDAIYVQDKNGRFLDVNNAVVKMYGYPKKFFIGKTPQPLSAPRKNDTKKIKKHIHDAFKGKPQQFEFWGKRKNGEVFLKNVRLNKGTYFGREVIFAMALDITQQKEAENAIRESNERFRTLVETTSDWIWEIDLKLNYTYSSPMVKQILGYDPSEIQNKKNYDFMPPKEAKIFKDNIKNYVDKKEPFFVLENSNIHKNGNIIILETSAVPIFNDKNKLVGYRGINRDITERKKNEIALKESEKRYRDLFEYLPEPVVIHSEGKIISMNKAAEIFAEIEDRRKLYGKSVLQFVHPDYRNVAFKRMQKVFINKENLALEEEKFITAKGNIRTVEVVAVPIQIEEKISSQVVFRDITDRKLAEQEIQRLATVVEQAVDSIIITDVNGTIKYVNQAFEKVTGFKKKEVLGQNPRMFKSGMHGREFYNDLWSTIKSGKKWQGVIINKKKNKNIFYERAVIFPLKNENGKIINFAGIMRDITLERKLEDQLQQIQKMEAIGTLSGGVAHDFNNILTVINGHAEIAMMHLDQSHFIYNDLLSILNAGKRAERLTSQLLAFSRKQIHELQVININQTIKDLDKMLRRLIPEDIEIISDFPEDLPYIKADPSQIEQIIFNLVINARDAITDKREKVTDKKIYIKTKLVDLDTVFVDIHPGSKTGPHILLSVKDTGEGMESDVKNRIFEPFFTTKEVDKGTGLGLATVYGIVKQNNGSIYVESSPGEGSRFDIYWPVTTESPAKEYIETINQKELSGKESILFVEDDEGVRQFACAALKSFGYTIIEAQNGKNALQLTKKEDLKIDLIVTDLIMPEMNGHELVKQVISFRPDLKAIYVSGYTFEHLLKDGEVDESINFLQKPYTIQNLLKKIKEALNN